MAWSRSRSAASSSGSAASLVAVVRSATSLVAVARWTSLVTVARWSWSRSWSWSLVFYILMMHDCVVLLNYMMFAITWAFRTEANAKADTNAAAEKNNDGSNERARLWCLHHGVLLQIKWMRHALFEWILKLTFILVLRWNEFGACVFIFAVFISVVLNL